MLRPCGNLSDRSSAIEGALKFVDLLPSFFASLVLLSNTYLLCSLLASFDHAVGHRTEKLLRKQCVDSLDRERRLAQQRAKFHFLVLERSKLIETVICLVSYNGWIGQPPSLISNIQKCIVARAWVCDTQQREARAVSLSLCFHIFASFLSLARPCFSIASLRQQPPSLQSLTIY
ncbi:hypothetical protein DFH11DRAFT_510676 [Phellopilus nigrolimitatus]|nr:hypothetical protein DFH11DRAFT_510676 [Phellopilus nigrolimitatus]